MNIAKKTSLEAGFDLLALMIGNFSGTAFSVIFSILMTRFLLPSDYGFVASNLFIFTVFNWLSDWGLEQALLAWSESDFYKAAGVHLTIRFIFGSVPIIFLIGLWFFGFCSFDRFFILFVLACSFFFQKIGFTFKTVLEKFGKLKALAGLEFAASTVAVFCAFCMAVRGFGTLSLAGQLFIERLILFFGYFFASDGKIGFCFDAKIARKFLTNFGIPLSLAATFGLAIYDFMPFLIDKVSGVTQAGLYARSFSISTMPLMITGVFGRIANTIYAQNQFDKAALAKWFACLQTLKAIFIIPSQLFLIFTSPWWSNALFAGKWAGFWQVYAILAIYGLARSFYDDTTNLISIGLKKPWQFTRNQAVHFSLIMLMGPAFVFAGRACGGALAMAFSMSIVTVRFWRIIFKFLELNLNKFFNLARSTLYLALVEFVRTGKQNFILKRFR